MNDKYKRQSKYVSGIKKFCKRVSIWVPKDKEPEIKTLAQKWRAALKKSK